jgi:hypothetical protein
MNNKLYNAIKLKMVMKIHGLSRQEAKERITKETPTIHTYNINREPDDDLISVPEFFGVE